VPDVLSARSTGVSGGGVRGVDSARKAAGQRAASSSSRTLAEAGWVYSRAVSLFLQEVGPAAAPAIVFLHGGGFCGWMWRPQIAALSAEYRCLVPDLPEHGQSRAEGPFCIEDAAARVADLIRARAPSGRAHLVGLSLGAQTAIQLLATAPEVVDHVLCSGTNVRPVPGRNLVPWSLKLALPLNQFDWFVRANARANEVPDAYFDDFSAEARATTEEAVLHVTTESLDFRLPRGLERVTARTLLLVGERERRVIYASASDLAAAIPGAEARVFADVGHLCNLLAPERFTATVRAWIRDEPLPEGLLPLRSDLPSN
jgi:pimeloyl-ACP methyl ester carboxylesterase